jgi:Vacuolar protein sorting protein 11 C terminal
VAVQKDKVNEEAEDDNSDSEEIDEILEDIQEALGLARRQGVLPPVRIARILAGEGSGQFSSEVALADDLPKHKTVPLSVALDYVGTILEESRKETTRLKAEVEEFNQLCNSMEWEIDNLLRSTQAALSSSSTPADVPKRMNVDELYAKIQNEDSDAAANDGTSSEQPREAFWRDMNESEDRFGTIARYFAKGVIN